MKVQKVNIYDLHAALSLYREKGIVYIDIEINEEANKLTLIESSFDTGETSELKLEDVL